MTDKDAAIYRAWTGCLSFLAARFHRLAGHRSTRRQRPHDGAVATYMGLSVIGGRSWRALAKGPLCCSSPQTASSSSAPLHRRYLVGAHLCATGRSQTARSSIELHRATSSLRWRRAATVLCAAEAYVSLRSTKPHLENRHQRQSLLCRFGEPPQSPRCRRDDLFTPPEQTRPVRSRRGQTTASNALALTVRISTIADDRRSETVDLPYG